MSQLKTKDVFKLMEQWAPKSLAYDWDPIGLQVGSYETDVNNILVTLDVSEAVVDEAINNKANLIISHHPLLFQPLKEINIRTSKGRIVQKLLKNGITVYSAHTNLDIAENGINDELAKQLHLQNISPLISTGREQLYKIVVFVPKSHVEDVRQALSDGGAGHIGKYSHCTFQSKGEGTFKPREGTDPYIGERNKLTYVDEYKVESIVPQNLLSKAIQTMEQAHPYEEVAYDIYPLSNKGKQHSLGRLGTLKETKTLKELCEYVKNKYKLSHVRVTGNLSKSMKKVAVIGGSGEKYIPGVKSRGADVLITGDVTYHQAQLAEEIGLAVIDAGHYIEQLTIERIKSYLEKTIDQSPIQIIQSKVNTNPFRFI